MPWIFGYIVDWRFYLNSFALGLLCPAPCWMKFERDVRNISKPFFQLKMLVLPLEKLVPSRNAHV